MTSFKAISRQQLLNKLSKRVQIKPEQEVIAFNSNGVIEKFIDETDFFILAMQDGEVIGGLSSELKDTLDEQAVILLATSSEEEARRAFEEFESEEVEPEAEETTAAPSGAIKKYAQHLVNYMFDALGERIHNDNDGGELNDADYKALIKEVYTLIKKECEGKLKSTAEIASPKAVAVNINIQNIDDVIFRVKTIVEKYFPDSALTYRTIMDKESIFFTFSYGKELDSFPSRIRNNDIMYSTFSIHGFDSEGNFGGGKLKLSDQGSIGSLKINGSRVASFKWKNITMNPERIFERLDNYFHEAKEFIDSAEGQKIMEAYNKDL